MDLSIHPSVCLSHLLVATHFRTNRPRDWYQTWWIHSLWYSSDLINFWSCSNEFPLFPGFRLVEQFPHICQQNTIQIGLIFNEPTHYEPPQAWLTFGHAPLKFGHFLSSDWSSSFCTFADNCWSDQAENGWQTHYGPPQAWWTFGLCWNHGALVVIVWERFFLCYV